MQDDPARGCVLVTGADGFVGTELCAALEHSGFAVRPVIRPKPGVEAGDSGDNRADRVALDIGPDTCWSAALDGVDAVVHLAQIAHAGDASGPRLQAALGRVNVEGTKQLGRAAAKTGVRRLVYISSIKVNGEATEGTPFSEGDRPRPRDAYGRSKWEAEQALAGIATAGGIELVVIRPPLVYGRAVKGNFIRLMRLVARQTPLPLASISNLRSLIYLGNLVDAIIACVESPAAAGKTYLVSDGEDISTPDLVRHLAAALGVQARLFSCPVVLLKVAAAAAGKRGEMDRLTNSLQVDGSLIRRELGWQAQFSLAQGLEETARWYWEAVRLRP